MLKAPSTWIARERASGAAVPRAIVLDVMEARDDSSVTVLALSVTGDPVRLGAGEPDPRVVRVEFAPRSAATTHVGTAGPWSLGLVPVRPAGIRHDPVSARLEARG